MISSISPMVALNAITWSTAGFLCGKIVAKEKNRKDSENDCIIYATEQQMNAIFLNPNNTVEVVNQLEANRKKKI